MSLYELQEGASFLETLENYSKAEPLINVESEATASRCFFKDDKQFWLTIIQNPQYLQNKKICLKNFVISDWVARIPGLYWMPVSKTFRARSAGFVSYSDERYTEFYPPGKSRMVMGGIGTMLFPPTDDGKVLMSASSNYNASLGVPLLVFPEVYEVLKSGYYVTIKDAKWQAMEESWSRRFASTDDIPRGYLVIDSKEKIEILDHDFPIYYHPFSIMEYENNNGYFYDYVYGTCDSITKDAEMKISDFFKSYAKKDGRYGEYLIGSNMVKPLFDARYVSPLDMNRSAEKANLELLKKRIRNSCFGNVSLDELIIQIPHFYDSISALKTLARKVGINPAKIAEGSAVDFSSQLINECINRGIVEILIDRILIEYPEIFK